MRCTLIIIVTFIALELSAQNYTRDGGIRIGDYFSVGFRHFVDDDRAIEAIFSAGRRGAKITVLKEHTRPALGHISENLYFVYGYGAHAGFRYANRYRVLNRTYDMEEFRFMPLLGLDGLVAIEYRLTGFPVIMSLDIKPYFEYSTIQIFNIYLNSIGFSVKYRF